ncbi:conserved membrane protein of unknown function [Tenacibaculum sp. 190130A14a]|uniref:Uncharacterized protein n=1 Tax=Tenacibaculum polynesiense TaxID=3137857 RepID=A0ABM9P717_9FLAO
MKIDKLEVPLKILWIGLTLYSIYIFSWLTFGFLTFGNLFKEKYTIWNLLLPNIITIGIVIFHAKEIVLGYKPVSYRKNIISLIFFSIVILILVDLQALQFKFLFEKSTVENWEISITLIMILASYIGIIMNRILKMKKLKNHLD